MYTIELLPGYKDLNDYMQALSISRTMINRKWIKGDIYAYNKEELIGVLSRWNNETKIQEISWFDIDICHLFVKDGLRSQDWKSYGIWSLLLFELFKKHVWNNIIVQPYEHAESFYKQYWFKFVHRYHNEFFDIDRDFYWIEKEQIPTIIDLFKDKFSLSNNIEVINNL